MKTLAQWLGRAATRAGIALMKSLAFLPLSWVRALGAGLGWVLYRLIGARRRVVLATGLCCVEVDRPEMSCLEEGERI